MSDKAVLISLFLSLAIISPAGAQDAADAQENEFIAELRKLHWVQGPTTVPIGENSTLVLPEGYVFLNEADTAKFEELNENLASGKEVMLSPQSLQWSAYFRFEEEGYIKDDEKIDADVILKSLTEGTEAANEERQRRGWAPLHVTGWAIPPAYNETTKRLEWATRLQSQGSEATNFFTKILGRRGYTSVVLVSRPEDTSMAVSALNQVLAGYQFNSGETYAEWKPGDKVATYGLAGLIVGGAAAAAAKSGLLKGLWKFLVVGGVAALAGIRSLFKRKKSA